MIIELKAVCREISDITSSVSFAKKVEKHIELFFIVVS